MHLKNLEDLNLFQQLEKKINLDIELLLNKKN